MIKKINKRTTCCISIKIIIGYYIYRRKFVIVACKIILYFLNVIC